MNGVRVKPHYGAGAIESLDYDGLHRLTKSTRTIGTNAPVIVDYRYDENGNITGKSDQAAVYAYSPGQPNRLDETRNSSGTVLESFGYDLNDPNLGIDYLHRDRLGGIVNITDVTGVIEEGRGFDAFSQTSRRFHL
jgi:YD repeat-containing protein